MERLENKKKTMTFKDKINSVFALIKKKILKSKPIMDENKDLETTDRSLINVPPVDTSINMPNIPSTSKANDIDNESVKNSVINPVISSVNNPLNNNLPLNNTVNNLPLNNTVGSQFIHQHPQIPATQYPINDNLNTDSQLKNLVSIVKAFSALQNLSSTSYRTPSSNTGDTGTSLHEAIGLNMINKTLSDILMQIKENKNEDVIIKLHDRIDMALGTKIDTSSDQRLDKTDQLIQHLINNNTILASSNALLKNIGTNLELMKSYMNKYQPDSYITY